MVAAVIGGIIGAVIGAIGGLMFGGPSATKAVTRHLERKQAEEFLADNYLPLIAAVDYLLDCEQKMQAMKGDDPDKIKDALDEAHPEVFHRASVMLHAALFRAMSSGMINLIRKVNVDVAAYIGAAYYALDQKMVAVQVDADRPDRQKRWKTTYPKLEMIRRLQQLLSELRMDDLVDRYDAALRKSLDLSSPNGN